jgi:hypothetical protein
MPSESAGWRSRARALAAWLRGSLLPELLVVAVLLGVFIHAAHLHAVERNTVMQASDQSAYLAYAERTRREHGLHLDGNRGPGYPLLLLLVHEEGLEREVFFERGKTLTVMVTAFAWLVIWIFLRRLLPRWQGLAAWAVIGLTCLIHYAPYVKTEAPFFALNCIGFVLLGALLSKPNPRAALIAGVVLGIAYLFKSTGRLVLAAYFVGAGLDAVLAWLRATGRPLARFRSLGSRLLAPGLVLVGFLVICAPFLIASYQKYGRAFYNVNDFYAWYDSWGEAKRGTRQHGDREGWPKMRAEDLPSPQKYFATHTSREVLDRLERGWTRSLRGMARLSMLKYAGLYLAALVVFSLVRFRQTRSLLARYGPHVLYALSFFVAHCLLSAWFEVIATGPRVIAAGFPVLIVACSVALFRLATEPGGPPWLKRGPALLALLAALLLVPDTLRAVDTRLKAARGGR